MKNWKILKSEADYDEAVLRLHQIADAIPGTTEFDELEILILIIEKYEEENFYFPEADPIEIIEFMMEQKGLRPVDLTEKVGQKSIISKVLNRQRALSIDMIRKFSDFLNIPPGMLVTEYNLRK